MKNWARREVWPRSDVSGNQPNYRNTEISTNLAHLLAGFARNFLYPEGYVVYATDENIIKYANEKQIPINNKI